MLNNYIIDLPLQFRRGYFVRTAGTMAGLYNNIFTQMNYFSGEIFIIFPM